jgi:hypothetical protein
VDDLIAAARELIAALEQNHLEYALGGALAFSAWAVPRATLDIDLNLFCEAGGERDALAALLALGVEGTLDAALKQAEEMGIAYLRWRGIRLDVFVPSIAFYEEARRTRVRLDIPGLGAAWVLSPEALAVFKLLFFRPKDRLDLEKLLAVQGPRLDRGYIRAQLVAMLGEDDERITFWDSLPPPS